MIIFISGEDTFRSREYLHQSIEQFKKARDPQGYNVVVLDAKAEDSGRILTELNTAPFLAEKRLLVLENLLARKDDEALEMLLEKTKSKKISESLVLIIWQGEAVGKSKNAKNLSALLAKEKYAREFSLLTGAEFINWIMARGSEAGSKISRPTAEAIALSSGDTWEASALVDILTAYANNREITPQDVAIFAPEKLDDSAFVLVDAIVQGNRKQAIKLLEYQRNLGEEDTKIFGLIIWQVRILLEMADLLEREPNLTSDAIAGRVGIHPFVARKNINLARRLPLSVLNKTYTNLLEIDRKTKTGEAPQSLLIDLFIASAV